MSNLTCSNCGTKNDAGANFCGSCGSPLKADTCPSCGNEVSKDWKFCKHCGYNLSAQASNSTSTKKEEKTAAVKVSNKKTKSSKDKNIKKSAKKVKSSGKGSLFFKKVLLGAAGIMVLLIAFLFWPFGGSDLEYGKGYSISPKGKDIIETEKHGTVVKNQIVVLLTEEAADKGEKIAELVNGKVTGYLELINLYQINVEDNNFAEVEKKLQKLKEDSRVESAFMNIPVTVRAIEGKPCPNQNPYRGNAVYENPKIQKSSEMIGMQKMWDLVKRSGVELNSVHLGIADKGINKDAAELNGLDIEGDLYGGYLAGFSGSSSNKIYYKMAHQNHATKIMQQIAASDDGKGVSGAASLIRDKMKISSKNISYFKANYVYDEDLTHTTVGVSPSWNGKSREEEREEFNGEDENLRKLVEEEGEELTAEEKAQLAEIHEEKEKLFKKRKELESQLKYEVKETDFGTSKTILPGQEKLEGKIANIDEKINKINAEEDKLKEHPTLVNSLVHLNRLVQSGATIINASYGAYESKCGPLTAEAYNKYLKKVAEKNPEVIFISAAGNDNTGLKENTDFWTGKHDNVINVTAVNEDGSKDSASNYSEEEGTVDVSAPTYAAAHVEGQYQSKNRKDRTGAKVRIASGTSFAAPYVTSTVAVMKSINPDLTAKEIKDIITKTASKNAGEKTYDNRLGKGILQMDAAVLKVINQKYENEGKTPLDPETFFKDTGLKLKAEKDKDEYIITAEVSAVYDSAVDLKLEAIGEDYTLKDDEKASLSSPGIASWRITAPKETIVKVTRLDTGYCSYVNLTPHDWKGIWTGGFYNADKEMMPLGFNIKKVDGDYKVEADIWPESVFGDYEHVINGFTKDIIIDYKFVKDFANKMFNPDFKNFKMKADEMSFDLTFNLTFMGKTKVINYKFTGKLDSEGILSGNVNCITEGTTTKWYMKKGNDGIIPANDDFKGFWEVGK